MNQYDYISLFKRNINNRDYDKIDYLINYSDKLSEKYAELYHTNKESKLIQDPYVTLIDLYKNIDIFTHLNYNNNKPIIREKKIPNIKDYESFLFYFNLITENILSKIIWDNIVIVGDIVLLALLYDTNYNDIYLIRDDINNNYRDYELDIYLYGNIDKTEKIKYICKSIMNIMLFKPSLISGSDTISLVSDKYYPKINIHTGSYISPTHILLESSIIDTKKILFDYKNNKIWVTPKSHYNYVYSVTSCDYSDINDISVYTKLLKLGYGIYFNNLQIDSIDQKLFYTDNYTKDIDKLLIGNIINDIDKLHDVYKQITFFENLHEDKYFYPINEGDSDTVYHLIKNDTKFPYNPLMYSIVVDNYDIFCILLDNILEYTEPFKLALKLEKDRYVDILVNLVDIDDIKDIIIDNSFHKYYYIIIDHLTMDDIIIIINSGNISLINLIDFSNYPDTINYLLSIDDINVFRNIILNNKDIVQNIATKDIYDVKKRNILQNLGYQLSAINKNILEDVIYENRDIQNIQKYNVQKYINIKFSTGYKPFEYCIITDNTDLAYELIKYDIDHKGCNYVKLCALYNSKKSIIFLNNHAKDVFSAYHKNELPPAELSLCYTDYDGNCILHYLSDPIIISLVNTLRPNLINLPNNSGCTCISYAKKGCIVEKLLQLHSDPLITDNNGFNQFHNLILNGNATNNIIDVFIRYYPDILNICTKYENYTPLMIAICQGYDTLAEHMIKRGADTNINDIFGNTIYHYMAIVDSKLDIYIPNIQNVYHITPYMYGFKLGNLRYVNYDYDDVIHVDKKIHINLVKRINDMITEGKYIKYII